MDTATAWQSGRPIYSRLPGANEGYRKDPDSPGDAIADWLTIYWDEMLTAVKAEVDEVRDRQMDSALCDPEWLDFLAQMCGFVGEYWDKGWADPIKRDLIANSFGLIWANKGSKIVLEYLLTLFALEFDIWMGRAFYAGITKLPAVVGRPQWRYYIRLPLKYLRDSQEFKFAEKLNRLYGPVFAESRVCYRKFYAGFSVAGDPVFS